MVGKRLGVCRVARLGQVFEEEEGFSEMLAYPQVQVALLSLHMVNDLREKKGRANQLPVELIYSTLKNWPCCKAEQNAASSERR